jgi:hypothetical protein
MTFGANLRKNFGTKRTFDQKISLFAQISTKRRI